MRRSWLAATVVALIAGGPAGAARAQEPTRPAGPTGGVAIGIATSGPTLQVRAGARVAPRLVLDARAGLYAFTAEIMGAGPMRVSYASTRFAAAGGSVWLLPSVLVGVHAGVVRMGEMLTDETGTAEVSSIVVPAVSPSVGWQFLRRPHYALGVEAQGWFCFSDRTGFIMGGGLLLGTQIR